MDYIIQKRILTEISVTGFPLSVTEFSGKRLVSFALLIFLHSEKHFLNQTVTADNPPATVRYRYSFVDAP
jgi:hypothetical protein